MALLLMASLPLAAQQEGTKVKPAQPTPPPTAQARVAAQAKAAARKALGAMTVSLDGVDNKKVSLRWNNPETMNGLFDDFESHSDFVINSPGEIGWQYIDADNADTYTWTATDFPNQGQKMAFIVFNPSSTSPSTEGWPDITPYSGKKMLIDFTVDGGNNDYIISPELNFSEDFQFSFQARSYTDRFGKERYRVGYSTTGTNASDFTFVQEGDYAEVPAAWTLCKYTIPKEAKYVCINCVSQEAFMFMVDDIFIGTNIVRPKAPAAKLNGFNILRDGKQLNDDLVEGLTYSDDVPDYGTYSYTVQAVMTSGDIAATTEPLQVEVPDIRYIPFEDDFEADAIDTTKWSMPTDEAGNENKWQRDYYAYGLVDYSACYPYSYIGTNYSQSLESRELRTKEPDNTYLRFQLRLDNNPQYTGSYMSPEVSVDGGNTWTTIASVANDEGSFYWRTYEFSLAQALAGAEFFKVRFRAHGSNSQYINYWYVDDVKVWSPQTRQAQVNVVVGGQPAQGASVTLTADHGAEYTGVTDQQGAFTIQRMELGTYQLAVEADGCSRLDTTWTLTADGSAEKTVALLRPIVGMSTTNLVVAMPLEAQADTTVTISNTGDGEVFWSLTPKPQVQTGKPTHRFETGMAFDASGDLQSSIGFDGEYFYAASIYTLGTFYKYDREGRFVEEFSIPGMYYKLYDMTFDGTYFYGSDYSNTIFQLDFRNKRLVGQWEVKGQSSLAISHIAYDPRSDQFWVGGWTTLGRVDRDGNVTVAFYSVGDSNDDIAVMGSAFDNVSEGGPYLWLSNLAHSGNNEIDYLELLQFDLNTRVVTKVEHTATDVPGYKPGDTSVPVNIGGVEATTMLVPGQLTLVGILQQSPSRIFTYRLADYDSWYTAQPFCGTLQPGEQANVNVHLDTRSLALNDTCTSTLLFHSMPVISQDNDVKITLTANSVAAHPRPVSLKATVDETGTKVSLAWEPATGTNPVAYEVLRDSVKIATVETTAYEDSGMVRGTYAYCLRALYGEQRTASALTDTVCVTIKAGAPYFAPLSLNASIENNKDVTLTWRKPGALLGDEAALRWDNGVTDDGIGLSDGGYFYAGIAFDADDLEPYRGMKISSADIYLKEKVTALQLRIYKDGKTAATARVASLAISSLVYGDYNRVSLTSPVTIERGSKYIVAFMIMHDSGKLPLGVSNGTTIDGKSNLMSSNGREWYPASYAGFSGSNFNIVANIEPDSTYTETEPSAYRIERDGKEVGVTTDTVFTEQLSSPADYVYQVVSLYGDTGQSSPSNSASVTVKDLGTPLAPADVKASVSRNTEVTLRWGFPIEGQPTVNVDLTASAGTSPAGRPEYVSTFKGALTGESGIASDGNYIYTTRHAVTGVLNRYKMDGTFDASLGLASTLSEGFRNLAFDGTDFWATANGSAIHKLDMSEPGVAESRSISEIARHIAYVPTLNDGRGGFEVGDWETSIKVSMEGAKLGDGPTLKGAAGSAYFDGVLYTFEQGYENPYELCAYDFETGKMLWHNSISEWTAVKPAASASAGGLSTLHTKEGLDLLCLGLQESAGARFFFFDLGSISGLAGYNVYRDGVKVNDTLLAQRQFVESITEPGTYGYQVQTVYIDGSTSDLSATQTVTIVPIEAGEAPTDIKARPTTAGYNVNVSVVDPTTLMADTYESFENGTPDNAKGFAVTAEEGFAGSHSLTTATEQECQIVLSVGNAYSSDFAFSFVARNSDDSEGAGTVKVLTSASTTDAADFVNFASVSTTEAWKQYDFTLPAATRYVALNCPASYATQFIDAITFSADKVGQIYGYDIMRDGVVVSGSEPVAGVTFTDHNLLPGTYEYKVRAYYDNSSVSEWSKPVTVDVDYSNGHQAPGQLSVAQTDEGNKLQWSTPALSGVTELKWHNGVSADAAGMPSGGSYYAGVQFDQSDLADYSSMSISEVSFYVNQIPDVLFVMLYQGQDLVYEKYVSTLTQYSMNTVELDEPIAVNPNKTLRAVIYVEHNSITVPLGYDAGPAKTGRGDLYSSDGETWSTLTDNDIDGNWNITIGLRAYANTTMAEADGQAQADAKTERYARHAHGVKSQANAPLRSAGYEAPRSASSFFSGYNVYCNGEQINDEHLTVDAVEYLDSASHKGRYLEYQVKAIYPDYGEVGSNVVRILASGIDDVEAGMTTEQGPTYTVDGKRANKKHHGVVISNGKKRIQK